MKNRIYIAVVIGVLVGVWFLLPRFNHEPNQSDSEQLTPQEKKEEKKRKFYEKRERDWKEHIKDRNVPVEFFGKVVDEKGEPLEGVKVKYYIQQPKKIYMDTGLRTSILTDKNGLFHVFGHKGSSFGVENVTKAGYNWVQTQKIGFDYSSSHHAVQNHKAIASEPVVYTMFNNKSLPLLNKKRGRVALNWDGVPVRYNLRTGKLAKEGEIKITAMRGIIKGVGRDARYDWSLKIEIPDGRIQEIKSQQTHLAPLNGYKQSWSVSESVGNDWIGGLIGFRYLIFQLSDNTYGYFRLDFDVNPKWKKNLTIDATLNPTGGRLLYGK